MQYLYFMNTRLVNVRLDERRIERARRLRAKGITLSDLVRDAIDRQYEDLVESSRHKDAKTLMDQIYEEFPDPAGVARRGYDVHNRRQAAAKALRC